MALVQDSMGFRLLACVNNGNRKIFVKLENILMDSTSYEVLTRPKLVSWLLRMRACVGLWQRELVHRSCSEVCSRGSGSGCGCGSRLFYREECRFSRCDQCTCVITLCSCDIVTIVADCEAVLCVCVCVAAAVFGFIVQQQLWSCFKCSRSSSNCRVAVAVGFQCSSNRCRCFVQQWQLSVVFQCGSGSSCRVVVQQWQSVVVSVGVVVKRARVQ